jgi:replication factor C large subunit
MTRWLSEWKPGDKALLIYGPTGTGKSLVACLVASEVGFSVYDINSSESRSASLIKEKLCASRQGSLSQRRMILIDDIDTFSNSDRGGISEVIAAIKESANPIVMTASDAYDQKLRTLRTYCDLLKTRRVPVNAIQKKLADIAAKEKIRIGAESIRKIAENASGDVRSALNDLETLNDSSSRDREIDIFKVMNSVFRANDIRKAELAMDSSGKDLDELFWWVEQNIPLEYQSSEEIAKAFEILSKADMFNSMIRRNQNYRFKKYMKEMMASISLIGQSKKFIMYRPPGRLVTLGQTKVSRKESEEFYRSLGINSSMRKIKEQAPLLRIIIGKNFNG